MRHTRKIRDTRFKDSRSFATIIIMVIHCFNYKTKPFFSSNRLLVKIFWKTYILNLKTCFCGPFHPNCFLFLGKESKIRKTQVYRWKGHQKWCQIVGFPKIIWTFWLFKFGKFYWKLLLRKRDFKFSSMKNLFCLYNKTIERDYLINLSNNRYSSRIHIILDWFCSF